MVVESVVSIANQLKGIMEKAMNHLLAMDHLQMEAAHQAKVESAHQAQEEVAHQAQVEVAHQAQAEAAHQTQAKAAHQAQKKLGKPKAKLGPKLTNMKINFTPH